MPPCPKVGKKIACFAESKYSDGSRYLGEWSDDKRQVKGTLSYPNGSLYSGDWSNGKMTGNGEFYSLPVISILGNLLMEGFTVGAD